MLTDNSSSGHLTTCLSSGRTNSTAMLPFPKKCESILRAFAGVSPSCTATANPTCSAHSASGCTRCRLSACLNLAPTDQNRNPRQLPRQCHIPQGCLLFSRVAGECSPYCTNSCKIFLEAEQTQPPTKITNTVQYININKFLIFLWYDYA